MKYLMTEMEMKFLMIGRASLVTQMVKNLPAMHQTNTAFGFFVAGEQFLKLTCFLMQTLCRLHPDNGKSVCNLSRAGCNLSQWVSIISGAAEEFVVEFSFSNCLFESHTKSNLISSIHPADGTVLYTKV